MHTIAYSETIYGVKQSSKMWYEKYNYYFLQIGFTLCDVDPNVCIKIVSTHLIILGFCVLFQYLWMMMNNSYKVLKLTSLAYLTSLMLAPLSFVLGLSRNILDHSIHLSHNKYFTYIFKHFQMLDCKHVDLLL
jgi:hypothetical protein